eukprot:TRINITY_DN3426_c0_g1_i7.p1 TRINITY_DN3426_c0_g1~~TRINITY_DN3426_c0_g1_i7.p1  ORF type:complete len:260 (+),score=32.59 TRINITY_DN3426_c0_g1_i7:18-797(+)
MERVKHKILVLSGKGGVGKSTVAAQLAFSFLKQNKKVGLLDIDLCGPSIPKILGLEGQQIHQGSGGWVPVLVENTNLVVMSIGFLLTGDDSAVIWRGPRKNAFIQKMVNEVMWGELDYLIIDTPPGTSDEHLSVIESLRSSKPDGAVVVTTPQAVSLNDVRKEISFCHKMELPILGLVENMSGFRCPECDECTNIFSTGGGESLANQLKIPFIGRLPIDPAVALGCEEGRSSTLSDEKSLAPLLLFCQLYSSNEWPPKN